MVLHTLFYLQWIPYSIPIGFYIRFVLLSCFPIYVPFFHIHYKHMPWNKDRNSLFHRTFRMIWTSINHLHYWYLISNFSTVLYNVFSDIAYHLFFTKPMTHVDFHYKYDRFLNITSVYITQFSIRIINTFRKLKQKSKPLWFAFSTHEIIFSHSFRFQIFRTLYHFYDKYSFLFSLH